MIKIIISKAAGEAILRFADTPLRGGKRLPSGKWEISVARPVLESLERQAIERRCSISQVIIALCREKAQGNGGSSDA